MQQKKFYPGDTIQNSELRAGGSCNVAPSSKFDTPADQATQLEQQAAALGISPERTKQMQAYAAELRRKQPQMKPDRLRRKVAEHFKVKLT